MIAQAKSGRRGIGCGADDEISDCKAMELTMTELAPRQLRAEAERCFRLAHGIADAKLSDELEAIGHDFEHEADELEGADQRVLSY